MTGSYLKRFIPNRREEFADIETKQEKIMLQIAIFLGSTRPGRNGEAVAKWA
jgi:hypothetical protein